MVLDFTAFDASTIEIV